MALPDDLYSQDPNMSVAASPGYPVGMPIPPGYAPPPYVPVASPGYSAAPPVDAGYSAMPATAGPPPFVESPAPAAVSGGESALIPHPYNPLRLLPGMSTLGAQVPLTEHNPAISPVSSDSTAGQLLRYLPGAGAVLPDGYGAGQGRPAQKTDAEVADAEQRKKEGSVPHADLAQGAGGETPAGTHGGSDNSPPAQIVSTPAHETLKTSPENIDLLNSGEAGRVKGVEGQMGAITELGEAAGAKADAEATGHEAVAGEMGKGAESMEQIAKARQAFAETFEHHIEQLSQQASQMQIDPGHYMRSLGTWDRLRLGIASFLGGAAQGLGASKTNVGIDTINRGIDEDIASQRAQIELAGNHVNQMRGLFAEAYKATGDYQDATAIAKGLMTKMVAERAMADAVRLGKPEAIANAKLLAAKLQEHIGEIGVDLAKDRIAVTGWAPASTVATGGPAAGAPAVDEKTLQEYGKRMSEEAVPEGRAALAAMEAALAAPGGPPGVGQIERLPLIKSLMGTSAGVAIVRSHVRRLAQALATKGGRMNESKVDEEEKNIWGNGSLASLKAGVLGARQKIDARADSIGGSFAPQTGLVYDLSVHSRQLGRNKPTPGEKRTVLPVGGDAEVETSPDTVDPGNYETDQEAMVNQETHGKKAGAGKGGTTKEKAIHFPKESKEVKLK
jgi:hypothetical protein